LERNLASIDVLGFYVDFVGESESGVHFPVFDRDLHDRPAILLTKRLPYPRDQVFEPVSRMIIAKRGSFVLE
jgi:hypothetical protein